MKDNYKTSRRIIGILAVIISLIMTINEDISVKTVITILIFVVALVTSYLATPISRKIIRVGDSIANRYLRILFYFIILPVTLLIAFVLYILILYIYDQSAGSIDGAVITLLAYIATTVMVIVPYIQTLIVLACRRKQTDNKQ